MSGPQNNLADHLNNHAKLRQQKGIQRRKPPKRPENSDGSKYTFATEDQIEEWCHGNRKDCWSPFNALSRPSWGRNVEIGRTRQVTGKPEKEFGVKKQMYNNNVNINSNHNRNDNSNDKNNNNTIVNKPIELSSNNRGFVF